MPSKSAPLFYLQYGLLSINDVGCPEHFLFLDPVPPLPFGIFAQRGLSEPPFSSPKRRALPVSLPHSSPPLRPLASPTNPKPVAVANGVLALPIPIPTPSKTSPPASKEERKRKLQSSMAKCKLDLEAEVGDHKQPHATQSSNPTETRMDIRRYFVGHHGPNSSPSTDRATAVPINEDRMDIRRYFMCRAPESSTSTGRETRVPVKEDSLEPEAPVSPNPGLTPHPRGEGSDVTAGKDGGSEKHLGGAVTGNRLGEGGSAERACIEWPTIPHSLREREVVSNSAWEGEKRDGAENAVAGLSAVAALGSKAIPDQAGGESLRSEAVLALQTVGKGSDGKSEAAKKQRAAGRVGWEVEGLRYCSSEVEAAVAKLRPLAAEWKDWRVRKGNHGGQWAKTEDALLKVCTLCSSIVSYFCFLFCV